VNAYPLHPGQSEVYGCTARHRFVVCGRGWGKTHEAIAEIGAAVTSPRAAELGEQFELVYVGPSYRQVKAIVWKRLKSIFAPHTRGKPHETDLILRLKWGPTIRLMGADNVNLSRGLDIHFAILDEFAFYKEGVWETVEGCLRTSEDRALLITTPNGPNFAFELWNSVQSDPEWATFQKPTWDNPRYGPNGSAAKDIEARRRRLAAQVFDQEYGAHFAALAGAIYNDFRPVTHVRPLEVDRSLAFHVGQDFNAGHYCAVIGQWRSGRLEVLDEVVTRTHLFDHRDRLVRWFESRGLSHRMLKNGAPVVTVWTDASGDYNATSKVTADANILKAAGFYCRHDAQNPPQIDRVHAVQSLLLPGDGTPRLYVDSACRELITALMNQKWNQWGKPEKAKGYDDVNDALGYMVNGLAPIRGPGVLKVA
jgi:hypothetical protein